MKWIRVKDKLPEEEQEVLLYGRKTYCCEIDAEEKYTINQVIYAGGSEDPTFYKDCYKCGSYTNFEFVTYWMPLPEVPNEVD